MRNVSQGNIDVVKIVEIVKPPAEHLVGEGGEQLGGNAEFDAFVSTADKLRAVA